MPLRKEACAISKGGMGATVLLENGYGSGPAVSDDVWGMCSTRPLTWFRVGASAPRDELGVTDVESNLDTPRMDDRGSIFT